MTAAPLCNLCGNPLDNGQHIKTYDWHCKWAMKRGGRSLVTTPGVTDFPPRCETHQNPTAPLHALVTCMMAYGHEGPHTTQDRAVAWDG